MPLPVLPFLRALRPHQWSKNVFVLAALGFAYGDKQHVISQDDVLRTLMAFFAFCFGSSAIYLLNDVVDVESDRAHPTKCKRPIAAGQLSIPAALIGAVFVVALSFFLAWRAGAGEWSIVATTGIYVAINLAYSFRLKQVVLLDVFCIAMGFLLRVQAGGLAAGTQISHWMLLCTLFLALFLALNKRRAELAMLGEGGGDVRTTLRKYNLGFLDQMVTVLAACTIVCYTMYTVDPETLGKFESGPQLVWSVPFVVFGIARYMMLVQTGQGGDNPTRIFLGADSLFLGNLVAWVAVVLAVLTGAL